MCIIQVSDLHLSEFNSSQYARFGDRLTDLRCQFLTPTADLGRELGRSESQLMTTATCFKEILVSRQKWEIYSWGNRLEQGLPDMMAFLLH